MTIDPATLSPRERYRWMIASIVPRPIAFVSTVSTDGVLNLAPFSYFNGVSSTPPIVSIAVGPRKGGAPKDTLVNVEATRDLVVNLVPFEIARPMVVCSGEYPPDVDEFKVSGLTPVPSDVVRPPRVKESPLSMEARLVQVVRVGSPPTGLILAEVVRIHVADAALTDGYPDPRKLRPVARLGGESYAELGDIFDIARPGGA